MSKEGKKAQGKKTKKTESILALEEVKALKKVVEKLEAKIDALTSAPKPDFDATDLAISKLSGAHKKLETKVVALINTPKPDFDATDLAIKTLTKNLKDQNTKFEKELSIQRGANSGIMIGVLLASTFALIVLVASVFLFIAQNQDTVFSAEERYNKATLFQQKMYYELDLRSQRRIDGIQITVDRVKEVQESHMQDHPQ